MSLVRSPKRRIYLFRHWRASILTIFFVGRVFESQSFMTSIRSLRHLRLDQVCFSSLYSILSVTTSLVDLTLEIDTRFLLTKGATFLAYLQGLLHLRSLQVFTQVCPTVELPPTTTSVLLPALTSFRVLGECSEVEWFASGGDTLHIPYLSNFIRVTGSAFFAARLSFSGLHLTACLCAHPADSIDNGPSSKPITILTQLQSDPGSALSAMLATLEDVFLFYKPSSWGLVPWREFFKRISDWTTAH